MKKVRLNKFDAKAFDKGASKLKIIIWYFINALIVRASWNPFMTIKIWLLKVFGAKVGKGLIIKNNVTIKSPWNLELGDNVWLGEYCWIDNFEKVIIGSNSCISQGALLITGNHDYKKNTFDYRNRPIILEDGVWIGARAVVCAGVTCKSHSVLSAGSVATSDLEAYTIYQGNPAEKKRRRVITE